MLGRHCGYEPLRLQASARCLPLMCRITAILHQHSLIAGVDTDVEEVREVVNFAKQVGSLNKDHHGV